MRRYWGWAKENPLFFVNGLFVVLTILVLVYPGPSDFRIRLLSLVLQLVGGYTVWHDLAGAGQSFGKAGWLSGTWGWLKRAPWRKRSIIMGAMGGGLIAVTGSARGRVRAGKVTTGVLADRVTALERNIEFIDQDLAAIHKEIDTERHERKEADQAEKGARETDISAVNAKLETALTASISVLLFGVVWLAVGAALSALAPELSRLFG